MHLDLQSKQTSEAALAPSVIIRWPLVADCRREIFFY